MGVPRVSATRHTCASAPHARTNFIASGSSLGDPPPSRPVAYQNSTTHVKPARQTRIWRLVHFNRAMFASPPEVIIPE